MKELDKLSVDELYLLGEIVFQYEELDILKADISKEINERIESSSNSLNVRFNMDMFVKLQIFDPWEFKVIRDNNINNLQELIDCDLNYLVGITKDMKKRLDWVRNAYDMEKSSRHK